MAKCYQCPKPAMYTVGEQSIQLCLDCYFKFAQLQQAQLENAERQMNYWSDMIDHQVGFPPSGPRFPPRSTVQIGDVTLHNIKVDNSIVGSINTGTVGTVDVAITSLKQAGEAALAEALTRLTQAVLTNAQLQEVQKNEVMEILSVLASEAATPADRQRKSVVKTLLTQLGTLIGTASDLTTIWAQWSPIILRAFGG